MFVLMTKTFPELFKERRPDSRNMTVEDLTEFLFSKHELKVYYFLIC